MPTGYHDDSNHPRYNFVPHLAATDDQRGIPAFGKIVARSDTTQLEWCTDTDPDPTLNGGGTWAALGFGGDIVEDTFTIDGSTTDPTLGTGGYGRRRYIRFGPMVFCQWHWAFGGSGMNAGSGTYRFPLPINSRGDLSGGGWAAAGAWYLYHDNSGVGESRVAISVDSDSTLLTLVTTVTGGANANVGSAVPWTWGTSDFITGFALYFAA